MQRRLKQLLYGLLFLTVFAGIGFLWYTNSLKPAPTCTDLKQNQGETEVDCGGPCAPCELRGLKQVTAGNVRFMKLGSDTAVVARLTNPNITYRARVAYAVRFIMSGGKTHEETGTLTVYPGIPAYLYALRRDAEGDMNAAIDVRSTEWETYNAFAVPDLAVRDVETEAGAGGDIVVTGSVDNRGFFALQNVEIIAILKTENEVPIFASRTEENVPAGGSGNFTISFPRNAELLEKVSVLHTEVIAHAGE